MKNLQTHSRSSLFLMEIILAVLILALTSTACVQIFAASRIQRQKARELNHIQELTTSVGEILEGWDGEFSSFVKLLPPSPGPASPEDSSAETSRELEYFYDSSWNTCEKASSAYTMAVQLAVSDTEKKADLSFSNVAGDILYQLSIAFP